MFKKSLIISGLVYRIEIIILHVIVLYFLTGTIEFSIKTGIIVNGLNMIVYYIHHYIYLRYFNNQK